MNNSKRKKETSPDPYEDIIRQDKLDPYEALIKSNMLHKSPNKFHK